MTGYAVCVFGFSYYIVSPPVRVSAAVLATADYQRLLSFGQEQPATLYVFGFQLLMCVLELSYLRCRLPN